MVVSGAAGRQPPGRAVGRVVVRGAGVGGRDPAAAVGGQELHGDPDRAHDPRRAPAHAVPSAGGLTLGQGQGLRCDAARAEQAHGPVLALEAGETALFPPGAARAGGAAKSAPAARDTLRIGPKTHPAAQETQDSRGLCVLRFSGLLPLPFSYRALPSSPHMYWLLNFN